MCTVSVDVESSGQQNTILHSDGAMREWGNQQLIPALYQREEEGKQLWTVYKNNFLS